MTARRTVAASGPGRPYAISLNYAYALVQLRRFEEAKTLLRKLMPAAQRILGDNGYITLSMRSIYAEALYRAEGAPLDDLREAVATLEETDRTARRVLGGTHPFTGQVGDRLLEARAALRAREPPPPGRA